MHNCTLLLLLLLLLLILLLLLLKFVISLFLSVSVCYILVECNHFAQERKDIFGIRDVVESFRFHPTLIVLFLKQIELYYKF